MLRWLYIRLLWAHPAQFRYRFCDEMLEIFDRYRETSDKLRMLLDGALSVLRQWVIRPEFRQPWQAASANGSPGAGAAYQPIKFEQIAPYKPSRYALTQGGLAAILLLFGIVYAINHGGGKLRHLLIGMHRPGAGLIQVSRESMDGESPTTAVDTGRKAEDPWRPFARSYYFNLKVLWALDADHDLEISSAEIMAAPTVLRALDKDGDGKLSAEECGFMPPGDFAGDPMTLSIYRQHFMRAHPVLRVLDPNHNGELSLAEIANASAALLSLDVVPDGKLIPYEVMPPEAVSDAASMITRYDTNDDSVLSVSELPKDAPDSARKTLLAADRNHDGIVTRGELIVELAMRPH